MKKYQVPLIAQSKPMGCWAASIAMIVSWRDNRLYTPEEIAKACNYDKKRVEGLHPEDTKALTHWGLNWTAPQSFHVSGMFNMLQTHGPLWVATQESIAHVRVIVGMEPSPDPSRAKLYIQDPLPTLRGSVYIETFSNFCSKKNTLARRELRSMTAPIYTAYLKNPSDPFSSRNIGME